MAPITPRRIPLSCHPRVTEWTTVIRTHLPHLTKPQATVLALWSLGMVLARSCALTAVTAFLAPWLDRKDNTVRQQLREVCYEAAAKRRTTRSALRVETCLLPLLAWVVRWWQGTPLALALDATTLGSRLTVLVRSGVYRGCAMPVVWLVLSDTANHAWRREWLRMLRQVSRAVPRSWTVMVLADQGLYARWLLRRITRVGWHLFLRINTGGTLWPTGQVGGVPLKPWAPEPGTTWHRAQGSPSKAAIGRCTVRCWPVGSQGLRRFLKKNIPHHHAEAGRIKISHLGNSGWRSKRRSTACMAFLPSAMPL